jgi:hypothetical protein
VKGDVSLYVRLRPHAEEDVCIHVDGRNGIRLRQALPLRTDVAEVVYRCDHTFGPDASQEEVYQQAVTPICESVIRGYNGAVIAYGQTGSGKTHTMLGTARSKGVAPRAVAELFSALGQRPNWTVEVSVLEIYNERVRDLLAPGQNVSHVDIHEVCANDGNLSFRCPDATMWKCSTPEDALAALSEGMRRRETARTDMNHTSSRSHLIFTLCTTQSEHDIGATLRGRLHLVDLAGSERLKRSMSTDRTFRPPSATPRTPRDQRREAGEINKSLSQLALVIQRLTAPNSSSVQYVPYRDSMLTRLLAESFGGSSKTCIMITCSALAKDREETRCSLEFGKRAKLVKNKAEINLEVTHEPTPVMQALVQKEIRDLQRDKQELAQERDVLRSERNDLKAKLAATQELLTEAASDAMTQQQRRLDDAKLHEEEKGLMQRRNAEALKSAKEATVSLAEQLEELQGMRIALHGRLVEGAMEIARLKQENVNTVRQHEEEVARFRVDAAEQAKQIENARAQAAALRAESVALRERWLEDITRLENEKADLSARAEEEKCALQKRVATAIAEAAQQHEERARSRLGSAAVVEEAAAAAKQAEEDGDLLMARSADRLSDVKKQVEAAFADAAQSEQLRKTRLAGLEAEQADTMHKWNNAIQKALANSKASLHGGGVAEQTPPAIEETATPMDASEHGPPSDEVSECLPSHDEIIQEIYQVGQVVQSELTIDELWAQVPSTPKSCLSWDLMESRSPDISKKIHEHRKEIHEHGVASPAPLESGSSSEPFPGLRPNTL